ncbi:alpha/beta hydrolase [soil metagenome]
MFSYDPELAAALADVDVAPEAAGFTATARGDALALRAAIDADADAIFGMLPTFEAVSSTSYVTDAADGAQIELRWYTTVEAQPGPAVVYVHGGGLIGGTLDNYEPSIKFLVDLTGVPFLHVGYRLAPEYRGTVPAEDALAGIRWLLAHHGELGVDVARIAVMGDSGGGAVGAGAAILARDEGIELARQILIYPMLDDRNVDPDPHLADLATWTYDNNFTGWDALLGGHRGTETVSPAAAPARLKDFVGLAPAYIEVGEIDIFRDESLAYAARLWAAGVSCELHVHPGAPHGHEWIDPEADIARRSMADRVRVIRSL